MKRDDASTRNAHWARILAGFLKEHPDLCKWLQADLERAGIKVGLDDRKDIDDFAPVLQYVFETANVAIEDDLSHFQGSR